MIVPLSRVVIDTQALARIDLFIKSQPELQQAAVQRTYNKVVPFTVALLKEAPPRPNRKIEWTTERQRRAFFATNGFGRGIPTKRTGGATNWTGSIRVNGNVTTVAIDNPRSYLRFVRVVPVGERNRIQRFHTITGWKPVNPIAEEHQREMYNTYTEELEAGYKRAAR